MQNTLQGTGSVQLPTMRVYLQGKAEDRGRRSPSQKLAAIVTTAPLQLELIFPASQVIFETLLMGNRWLTANEFSQMLRKGGEAILSYRNCIRTGRGWNGI